MRWVSDLDAGAKPDAAVKRSAQCGDHDSYSCAMEVETVCVSQEPHTRDKYFSSFAGMKKTGFLCDIVIHVDNHSLQAHRIVLAAGIPHFQNMFRSNMVESGTKDVVMKNIDFVALQNIIDFLYTDNLKISSSNVTSLLDVSIYLQFDFVIDSCLKFLLQQISISNVLKIRSYAKAASRLDVIKKTDLYIRNNFENFCKTKEFLELPFAVLMDSISMDDLLVANEETVFQAIMRWLKAHEAKRGGYLFDLLGHVRIPLLTLKYLHSKVLAAEMIQRSPACINMVREVILCHAVPGEKQTSNCTGRDRCCTEKIYNFSQHGGSSVSCFEPIKMEWNNFTTHNLQHLPCISNVVCTEGKMYFLIGRYGIVLNLKTLHLTKLKCNSRCPRGAGVALHHQKLYFFGRSDTPISKNVKSLELNSGIYKFVGETAQQKKFPRAVSLGEYIYVIGGYSSLAVLKSCERYSPETGRSKEISPMLGKRNDYDCATVNGKIYVYGHFDRIRDLYYGASTGEVYNPLSDQWAAVKPMNGTRRSIHLASSMGKLFAVSHVRTGNAEKESECRVEIYDPSENSWKIGNPLPDDARSMGTSALNVLLTTNSAAQCEEMELYEFEDLHNDEKEPIWEVELEDLFCESPCEDEQYSDEDELSSSVESNSSGNYP